MSMTKEELKVVADLILQWTHKEFPMTHGGAMYLSSGGYGANAAAMWLLIRYGLMEPLEGSTPSSVRARWTHAGHELNGSRDNP